MLFYEEGTDKEIPNDTVPVTVVKHKEKYMIIDIPSQTVQWDKATNLETTSFKE